MSNPFHERVMNAKASGKLAVQPRMGFSDQAKMRDGLIATRNAAAATLGTITIDSFTRVGDHESAALAIATEEALNGYPLVAHGAESTALMCADVHDSQFPIQIRHGSAQPQDIVRTLVDAGFPATEGGPVSYCLPYSRLPISAAVDAWAETAEIAADNDLHLETFGGCMLGQLCPPSLLVALSVLEGLFFAQYGVKSISLSYAQQTNLDQDVAAVTALRNLADRYIGDRAERHTVIYTYMGVYPLTSIGSNRLLERSVMLAHASGAERLIVKTPAEAHRIPTIEENVAALELAGRMRPTGRLGQASEEEVIAIMSEADRLIAATLEQSDNVGHALNLAFGRGLLDVPFCLHTDNANLARATVRADGRLEWSDTGRMPISAVSGAAPLRSDQLLVVLNYNQTRFDREQLSGGVDRVLT
ncbi:methylaspartate mutase [Rhodococcus fascians]|nr:methylaspartate mutase [Rhodococcus fascians]MBY4418701.1 methylaspartate mutase [Rhodococcus fascians]